MTLTPAHVNDRRLSKFSVPMGPIRRYAQLTHGLRMLQLSSQKLLWAARVGNLETATTQYRTEQTVHKSYF
jgi:hypothetical protein